MPSETSRAGTIISQALLIAASLVLSLALRRLFLSVPITPDMGYPLMRLIRVLGFLVLPACYLLYYLAGRKLLKETMPFAWLLAAVCPSIVSLLKTGNTAIGGFIYYEAIFFWAVVGIVYFIEWVFIDAKQRIARKKVFARVGRLGVCIFLLLALKIVGYDLFISHDDSTSGLIWIVCIYLLFGGYRLLNGFLGITEEKCDRYLGSHNKGSSKVYLYEKLTGDAAVLFGLRSVLIWLAVPALLLAWFTGVI